MGQIEDEGEPKKILSNPTSERLKKFLGTEKSNN
jgi:ABC-type histidine transport system ATPase subunit